MLLAIDVGRDSLFDGLDTGRRQVFLALAELLIDPAGQNRGHDCRDDDGSGDLRIRGGRKLGIARSDLGEGDRRGHGRAGNGGTCHSRLTIAATQALEGKGNGTDDKERDEAQQDARNATGDEARKAHGRTELKTNYSDRGIGAGNQQVL